MTFPSFCPINLVTSIFSRDVDVRPKPSGAASEGSGKLKVETVMVEKMPRTPSWVSIDTGDRIEYVFFDLEGILLVGFCC